MSLKEKMTALADSVRSKSGVTGKLSIDKMITAIDSISAGGGGNVEYYKCAWVHRSPTEEVLRVEGAGDDSVNGEYRRIGEKSWKHVSNMRYCYFYTKPNPDGPPTPFDSGWFIGSNPGLGFDYALYYSSSIDGTYFRCYKFNISTGEREYNAPEPSPRVNVETVEIDPETLNTWDGYKAVWNTNLNYFTFSEELTYGFRYGDYFTPEVGKIYPADTRAIVEQLWTRGSDSGDVIGVPFSYYQCAAVYGPRKVEGIIVSGAGNPAVNGGYIPTGMKHEETEEPIYKHVTEEFYYITMWGDKGICTSPTQWASDGIYWYDQWEDRWFCATGRGGAEPAPTVTAGQITLDADVPKTWDGYGVYWNEDEGYKFSETLTTGLSYGTWLVPELGKIYDADARMLVSKLFEAVKPITTNDTGCLIYIDGTSLSNQGKAPNKHEVTFGSGTSLADGYINITNDESGQILTTAKADGYGGVLKEWTWDFYFVSDASMLDCSGHSSYGWTIEGGPGVALYFRGQSAAEKRFGVTYTQNELVGLSLQWQDGTMHIWNKGKYVGTCNPTMPNCSGTPFGIGCIADGDYDRMVDKLKFFRFSNKARYVPGQDFELPEGFI